MTPLEPYRLRPLEVASGLALGAYGAPPPLPDSGQGMTPLRALEDAVLPALLRPPCLVSFSGGRDSSAVLAVASRVARREGLPLPIPATNRFPRAEGSAESEWQEQVVAHLRLDEWLRIEMTDELDCVGPVAARVLARHGLLWPCNAHFHVPLLEAAAGGSLLTGVGGDETFLPSSWRRAIRVLSGRVRPKPRDVLRVGFALSPHPLRSRVLLRRLPPLAPWLRPHAQRQLRAALAREAATEPLGWAARQRWLHGLPYMLVGKRSLAVLAADAGVEIFHPLSDGTFLAALARLPRPERFESRTEAMRMLFRDLLPDGLLARSTKANFDGAFMTEYSRALAARWRGEGVDADLVDLDLLRAEWMSPDPDARSFTLLQSVWLALEGGSAAGIRREGEQVLGGSAH